MQADLEKGRRPIVKIPAVLRWIGDGSRPRHQQKAIFRARETDIAERAIVEFERQHGGQHGASTNSRAECRAGGRFSGRIEHFSASHCLRSDGSSCANSFRPRPIVLGATPVAIATAAIPP
jgi:hypothetical protein